MNNDLKRKQRRSMNESHLLSAIITSENTILNHLIKKSRLNESKLTSITSLLISSFVENFTSEASTSQTLKRTLNSLKYELFQLVVYDIENQKLCVYLDMLHIFTCFEFVCENSALSDDSACSKCISACFCTCTFYDHILDTLNIDALCNLSCRTM